MQVAYNYCMKNANHLIRLCEQRKRQEAEHERRQQIERMQREEQRRRQEEQRIKSLTENMSDLFR